MPRLLLITYYFPPDHVIPHKRSYRIAKAVAEAGWDVDVLTVDVDQRQDIDRDWRRLDSLPDHVRIYRTPPGLKTAIQSISQDKLQSGPGQTSKPSLPVRAYYRLRAWVSWPDRLVGWLPFAWLKGRQLLRQNHYDVIVTNSFPYTSHLVGHLLRWRRSLPWIVDMRDGWAISQTEQFLGLVPIPMHRRLHKWWMDKVMEQASSVWSLTPGINQAFVEHYVGKLDVQKFVSVCQGADFTELPVVESVPLVPDKFVLVYAGSFRENIYPSDGLMQGLQLLRERFPDVSNLLLIQVHGRPHKNRLGDEKARSYQVREFFDFRPMLPQREMLSVLARAAAQLILSGTNPWTKRRLSTKLFDYLATGRPILALATPDSSIAQVIYETRTGWTVPPDQPDLIAAQLANLLHHWQSQGRLDIEIDLEAVKRYSLHDAVIPLMLSELQRVVNESPTGK